MRPPRLPKITDYLDRPVPLVESAAHSPEGLSVPEIVMTYGNPRTHLRNALPLLPRIVGALVAARRGLRTAARAAVRTAPVPKPRMGSGELWTEIDALARELGCSRIGYTRVEPALLFRGHSVLYSGAVVLLMTMAPAAIRQAPEPASGREVWRTYYELGRVVNRIAKRIREAGYRAQPGPAIGGDANYPLLAQHAGLGHIGRHGLLLSRDTGPSQRIAVVYTDVPGLPRTTSGEHEWIPDFCDRCNRCVASCPTAAIHRHAVIDDEGHRHHIDFTKCAVAFSRTTGCSICIRECQFFSHGYDRIHELHFRKRGTS